LSTSPPVRGLELAQTYSYDFIILDLMPPWSRRGIAYEWEEVNRRFPGAQKAAEALKA
jgi:hypothetical protein